jgi:predicted RNA-binding Zn-ribbon protein involved in translation (DUF1610 family)
MRERKATLTSPVNGQKVSVRASHLRCPNCGEIMLRLDDLRRLRQNALAICRSR